MFSGLFWVRMPCHTLIIIIVQGRHHIEVMETSKRHRLFHGTLLRSNRSVWICLMNCSRRFAKDSVGNSPSSKRMLPQTCVLYFQHELQISCQYLSDSVVSYKTKLGFAFGLLLFHILLNVSHLFHTFCSWSQEWMAWYTKKNKKLRNPGTFLYIHILCSFYLISLFMMNPGKGMNISDKNNLREIFRF